MSANRLTIGDRTYLRNLDVDRFQVPFDELGDLRAKDLPGHAHVEIMWQPSAPMFSSFELYALNGGDGGTDEHACVYGGASIKCGSEQDALRMFARCCRVFPKVRRDRTRTDPDIEIMDNNVVHVFYSINFEGKPDALIREAAALLIQGCKNVERPDVHLLVCHASEDKVRARELAIAVRELGIEVWLDEWEIKVGDSIVQKIDKALASVSHLAVLLSKSSCEKPWVRKEFSAALMRHLSDNSIRVLPVLLEDCAVPPILADIRYADCRSSISQGVTQLEEALFSVA